MHNYGITAVAHSRCYQKKDYTYLLTCIRFRPSELKATTVAVGTNNLPGKISDVRLPIV